MHWFKCAVSVRLGPIARLAFSCVALHDGRFGQGAAGYGWPRSRLAAWQQGKRETLDSPKALLVLFSGPHVGLHREAPSGQRPQCHPEAAEECSGRYR